MHRLFNESIAARSGRQPNRFDRDELPSRRIRIGDRSESTIVGSKRIGCDVGERIGDRNKFIGNAVTVAIGICEGRSVGIGINDACEQSGG